MGQSQVEITRPQSQKKNYFHNFSVWERRGEESLKNCIVGGPVPHL